MSSEQAVRGTGSAQAGEDAGTRPLRRFWTVLTASDPGLGRLRTASTTVATLLVALGVLYAVVTLWSQPVTAAVLGVVVAMIASIAVDEPEPGRRAVSIALLVPCAAATASLAAVLSPHQVIADAVFVVVAVGAVFLRLLGPRGMAMGMIGFIGYFLALFVQVTVAQLPVAIVAAAIGAGVAYGMGLLLRPRHPERDLRRMLAALGVRAGSVIDALSRELEEGAAGPRESSRLRRRMSGCGSTALQIEQRLESADEQQLEGLGNDELSVRVFDFELGVEHLVTVALVARAAELPAAGRAEFVAVLDRVGAVLQEGTGQLAVERVRRLAADLTSGAQQHGPGRPDDELDRLLRALQVVVAGWLRVVDPSLDEAAAAPDDGTAGPVDPAEDAGEQDDDPPSGRWADTARQAVQVGLAAALAIVVGELISSTRWFWAAIAAFVVFTGTDTRGQTLSKGWQRVLGTLAGVCAGVVVAALVGGNTVAALVLIVLSIFLGIYLMRISSGWMMFFITTMLALLYGLLGQFSVGLLLVRLEETAAGAAIGVLVSFLVFPSSTSGAVRSGVGDFLTDLGELLEHLAAKLTGQRAPVSSAQAEAGALRESFDALTSTAKPLTEGLAGVANRSGPRRTLRAIGACEYHARVLARLADSAAGTVTDPDVCRAVVSAVHGVRDNVESAARALDGDTAGVPVQSADQVLDALDRAAEPLPEPDRDRLSAVVRQLRALDAAVCGLTAGHAPLVDAR